MVSSSQQLVALICATAAAAPIQNVMAGGAECQNQAEIELCRALCSATEGTCGALCNFTSGACWVGCQAAFGSCDLGCAACDAGCSIGCCPLPDFVCDCGDCRAACDDCRTGCNRSRADCENGCRLDCDNCVLNCESGCQDLCRPFRKIGEHCAPVVDRCAHGLVCWPIPFPGELLPQCFPVEDDSIYPDEVCRSLYSSELHQGAIDLGAALTFGSGSGVAAVLGVTQELGNVYGPDGRYGCYASSCIGAVSTVEIGTYASVGFFNSYDDFGGEGITIVEEAGEGISFVTAQVLNLDGRLIGTADCLSLGVSLLPISVGVYDCVTIVDTVGQRRPTDGALIPVTNSTPLARCRNVVVCADALTCDAHTSINNGSVDPDGDVLVLSQLPSGPYGLGDHEVTLRVADSHGQFDECLGRVTVDDCRPAEPDYDRSGSVDLKDAATLFNCHTGRDASTVDHVCHQARVDCDADIDHDDLRHFVSQLRGPCDPRPSDRKTERASRRARYPTALDLGLQAPTMKTAGFWPAVSKEPKFVSSRITDKSSNRSTHTYPVPGCSAPDREAD